MLFRSKQVFLTHFFKNQPHIIRIVPLYCLLINLTNTPGADHRHIPWNKTIPEAKKIISNSINSFLSGFLSNRRLLLQNPQIQQHFEIFCTYTGFKSYFCRDFIGMTGSACNSRNDRIIDCRLPQHFSAFARYGYSSITNTIRLSADIVVISSRASS